MTKQKYKNKKPLKKMYDFGLGSDAAVWEEATRHFSGYSPRPTIGGMGSYDIPNAPSRQSLEDARNIVSGTLRGLDTEIYRRVTGMEEANRGKPMNSKEFSAATQRMSGYAPRRIINNKEIKTINDSLVSASKPEVKTINRLLSINQSPLTPANIGKSFNEDTITNIMMNSNSISEIKNKIQAGVALASAFSKGKQ
jgi:hypothetical protein